MTDATLFAAGSLFTQDYLVEGITQTPAWAATDAGTLRDGLAAILAGRPAGCECGGVGLIRHLGGLLATRGGRA